MVQSVGREDLAFDQTKVGTDVGGAGFVVDLGMPDRVETVFVGPRVEGGEIDVVDLFIVLDLVMQLDGVGASSEEGVARLESRREVEGLDESTHGLVLLLELGPLAFPHDDDVVAFGEEGILFEEGGFVGIAHGLVVHLVPRLVAVGETFGAPVPKAAVEFVDGLGDVVVPVHVVGFSTLEDHVFSTVTSVTDGHVGFPVEVRQPFQGRQGMGFALLVPAADGFRGQLSFGHVFGAVEEVAGRGDGDTALEGVEPTDLFEFLAEHLARAFEQEHVRFAVSHEFLLKLERRSRARARRTIGGSLELVRPTCLRDRSGTCRVKGPRSLDGRGC